MEKMKFLKKIVLKRKMTKTEKILLSLLGTIILSWGIFRITISPQYTKLQALNHQRMDYEERISQINAILKDEDRIDKERQELYEEKTVLSNRYFPYIDQPELILLLDELIKNENLEVLDINFTQPKKEYIGDYTFSSIDVYMPFRASYQGLVQTLKGIKESPKKILITDLITDCVDKDILSGNLSMRIYSFNEYEEGNAEEYQIDYISSLEKETPFTSWEELNPAEESIPEDELSLNSGVDLMGKEESYHKETLEDFETGNFYFIPTSKYIKGGIYKSANAKSNRYSIRFEYNILALEDENRAYLDLANRNIIIKYPPETIGLWMYSFGYSPATLGFRMKGQAGEILDIEVLKGVSWIGWNYIEVNPPQDISLYPLQLDKIYIELAYNRDDYGVLLLDQIEANYPKESNESKENFTFYIVEKGDSLDSISIKFYGTNKKKDIIMKKNEIKSDNDIKEGKILVIPR